MLWSSIFLNILGFMKVLEIFLIRSISFILLAFACVGENNGTTFDRVVHRSQYTLLPFQNK